jgi:UDP-3-O-[3-hydroxymyristoyl] N-acetylglucosamine deacetylase
MKAGRQTTLCDQVAVSGIGVHSGLPVTLTLHPADPNSGIIFVRSGIEGRYEREIRADVRAVTATEFQTVLSDSSGPLVCTSEHVLAAIRGLGIDNVIVELDGPEAPIGDGSAAPFVAAIDQVGTITQSAARRYIQVLKPVRVTQKDGSYGELRPYAKGFRLEAEIEFDHPLIGRQSLALDLEPQAFRRELSRARTFGFMKDVAKLWSAGFALGASFENTLVVTENRVLNPDGLRFTDEFVRHKALDAIGDLALAGAPILGAYRSVRGGHKLNHAVLSALIADPDAWTMIDGAEQPAVAARRVVRGYAEVANGLAAAAYGPDRS